MADKKQIILGVGLDSTDVKQGTEEISRSVNKMAGDVARESIQAGKAVSKIGDEALSSAEDFSKAESKIIQSIQRRTAALEAAGKGARAYQEALISNRGLDPAKFDAYLSKLDAADKATQRLGQSTANVGSGVSGQFSNNLRNASFQIQDFAVQVNGGVDATKALAMQLPQMLVGFGTAGAVVGVFAALLPNLITLMGGVGDGSKKLSDAIGDLDKAIGDVGSTVKKFDMEGLYEQFNNANKATQAAIVGQLEFQKVFLETSRLVASKKFGDEIGGLGSFGTLDKLAGAYASSGSEKLAKQLGVSLDVAKDLLPVLNGLKNGTEDVNNAFSRFGTSLLSGNAESRALASSMASLAKSERDAAAASSAISEAQEKMAKGHVTTKKELEAANKAQKEHNTELEKFQALMDKINGKDTGLDASYWKDLEALNKAYNKGRLNLDEYSDAVEKLTKSQKFYTDQLKEQAEVEASRAKYLGNIEKETEELVKKAEAAELENAKIGATAEELEYLNRKRYESQIAILSEKAAAIEAMGVRNAELENIEKQIDALRRLQSAEVARPKLQAQAREWEKFTDQIGQSLTDALYRAFESGEGFGKSFAKTLENTLKATFAKLLINTVMTTGGNLTNTAINAILGTSSANGGAGTNYLGLASNASSIYNLANGNTLGAIGGAYSYGSTALGYTYGTNALSQQSMMLAAQDSGLAGSGSAAGLSSGAIAGIAAIVVGMYMSSQAWKDGIRANGDWSDNNNPNTWQYALRDWEYRINSALFGEGFAGSEFMAILTGNSLQKQVSDAILQVTGNNGAPKTNVSTRFDANAITGISARPFDNGSTAYAGGQESLAAAIFTPAVALAVARFAASDTFGVSLWGHINNRGRSSNQKLGEVLQGGETIYSYRTESGQGMGDFQRFAQDQIPKMQLAIIAEAMRDSSSDYQQVVDLVLGTSRDLTSVISSMTAWRVGNTVQELFVLADAFDQIKAGLGGLPVQFADLAAVADDAKTAAASAIPNIEAQIAAATSAGDTSAVQSLTNQLTALRTAAAETNIASVTRVIRETQIFTDVLDMMGKELSDVFNASNSAQLFSLSESLVNLFGGIDAATSSINAYYTNFYSASEQQQRALEAMSRQFTAIGLAMPTTRDAFRDLVEAQDLTTESGQRLFAALIGMSGAFSQVIDAVGSTVRSLSSVNGYLDNYMTPAERHNYLAGNVQSSLASMRDQGYFANTQTEFNRLATEGGRANFRALIEAQDLTTESGRRTYNALLDLSPAFAEVTRAITDTTEAAETVSEIMKSLQLETSNLQVELLRAQGNESGANAAQRALDTEGMTAAEIAVYDFNASIRQTINTLNEASQNAQRVASERSSLEMQLLQLQGNTVEIRRRERAALDESNRALYDQIKALEDAAVAQQRAKEAASSRVSDAYSKLQAAYSKEAQGYTDTINRFTSLGKTIREFAKTLANSDDLLTSKEKLIRASAEYTSVSTRAKLGDADAMDKFVGVSQNYLDAVKEGASTAVEYARALAMVGADANATSDVADRNVSVAQSQLDTLKSMLGGVLKLDNSILSVRDAIRGYNGAVGQYRAAGGSTSDYQTVRGFASGGLFSGGLRLVGENGPELEVTGPSRIINSEQTENLLRNLDSSEQLPALLQELNRRVGEMNREIVELRGQQRQTAVFNLRTAKILEKWDGDGQPDVRAA